MEGAEDLVTMFSRLAYERRADDYKSKGSTNQEVRRRERLDMQKKARKDLNMQMRVEALKELEETATEEEIIQVEAGDAATLSPDPMAVEKVSIKDRIEARRVKKYGNHLMSPESMQEIPGDLADKWLSVPFPAGMRCIVVASRGETVARLRNGHLLYRFKSRLPGSTKSTKSGYTILDCIFHEGTSTFYVLDVQCWNKHEYYDCDTEFRFFWLLSKFREEVDGIDTVSATNEYRFVPLRSWACDRTSLAESFNHLHHFKPEGILFYHKETHYYFDSNPLMILLHAELVPKFIEAFR